MTSKDLRKLQNLFNKSIELLEIDVESSLFISRKGLELVIHKYFEVNDLEKKEPTEEYPVLSTMIKKLTNAKHITKILSSDMEYIRKKGNNAVHFTGKPVNQSIAKGSINRVAKIIVWYLEEIDSTSNTFYISCVNVANYPKKRIEQYDSTVDINNMIYELCHFSIFKSPYKFWDIVEDIDVRMILDDELIGLIEETEKIVRKYLKIEENYVDNSNYLDELLILLDRKKRMTSVQYFKHLYSDQLLEIKELRKIMLERYF